MVNSSVPHTYSAISATLDRRLSEPAPARVQSLTGPRQVGKTHLLRRLERGYQGRSVYAAADALEAGLAGRWGLQWGQAERLAWPDAPAVLIIDEIHYLRDWNRKLKAEHDAHLLEQAYLLVSEQKPAQNATRGRAAPPKLVTLNQGILAPLSAGTANTDSHDPLTWWTWVENACIAHPLNAGQHVKYWRAEPYEVDMVSSGSWGDWAVEVKTGAYATSDLAGLLELCKRFPRFKPLLLCEPEDRRLAQRMGSTALPWREYLLSGPPQ